MKLARRPRQTANVLDSPHVAALFEKVRLATGELPVPLSPPPEKLEPALHTKKIAVGLMLLCAAVWWCYRGSWSPWIVMTLPASTEIENTVAGKTKLFDGDFFHEENFDGLRQLNLIRGATSMFTPRQEFDDRRVGYAVLGNLFTLALNPRHAFSALNLVLFWLCALLVAQASETLFADRSKSLLAAALFVLSIAAAVHVGDLSPHFLGFAFSFLWTLLLLRIDQSDGRVGWKRTIALSALLGAWSLVDGSSLAGLAIYALFLLKRQNGLAIVLPGLAWYGLPLLQQAVCAKLGVTVTGGSVAEVSREALAHHWDRILIDPGKYLISLVAELGDFVFDENPLNVLVALVGLFFLRHRSKWLLSACYFTPIVVAIIFLPGTIAHGSVVAGNTVVIFVLVSHFAVEFGRTLRMKSGAPIARFSIACLLVIQAAWGSASLGGWFYPCTSYGLGVFKSAESLAPTEFVRMSESIAALPTSLGGTLPATNSGGLPTEFGKEATFPQNRVQPYKDHWAGLPTVLSAMKIQAPLLCCVFISIVFLCRWRWSLLVLPALATWIAAAQIFAGSTTFDLQSVRTFEDRIPVKSDEKLVASIQLSERFCRKLERAGLANESVEFFVRASQKDAKGALQRLRNQLEFQVLEWSSAQPRFSIPAKSLVEAVKARKGKLEFSVGPTSPSGGIFLHSWQSLKTMQGREAALFRVDGSRQQVDWFPSFEIRIVRSRAPHPLHGVLEQFISSDSAGYALIGF